MHLHDSGLNRWAQQRPALIKLAVAFALSSLVACSSTTSGMASHAAVTIKGYRITDVALTTRDVFNDNGYALTRAENDRMIFERPSTKSEQIKYGSFGSSGVVMRVKVDLQEMSPETFFLRCDVFSVRDAGQTVLEDETRVMLVSAKSYQKILDEVKARLESKAPAAGSGQ